MQVLIIGAGGGVGRALVQYYHDQGATVQALSRQQPPHLPGHWIQVTDYTETSLQRILPQLKQPDIVISTLGILHTDDFMPEKRLADVNWQQLQQTFYVNAALPILLLQQLLPILPKKQACVWAQLSAKVGSITDNYLGGWYSYRSSKAALNMLLKTASVELKRTHKQLCLAAIHPGTTDTALSAPFQQRLPADKLYTPAQSAERIAAVINQLTAEDSGGFWHWDGSPLPY
ncbi:NAD(P)-dependent dehydrogenase, short-chain alcohol dehydrogenase family [Pseudidiomarina maritima]|uniref:NAD(P)-dependent dehydrogenase, short-chain alcohol dehydrogenase family n=1 Tax=Pseudidiomarina maritima TaxID=519453 RepID=A0A1I6H9B0_9GAMM|nr:SDR family NAD(P)-dependent oxidoreductase [Pseudidiomarina maritima]SFR50897.1 NAD(P)-dependent dehydrogenase, short-chain alcohol dehydrogenase family [Pseudidiomarina maritima]